MRPRYVVRITPDDVGSRVTVRVRVDGPRPHSDTVGVLVSWSDGVLRVQRRDGTVVELAESDVVAARVIPPRTARE